MARTAHTIVAALLACTISGCVADKQYRAGVPVATEALKVRDFDRTQTDLEGLRSYRLAFMEFKDNGQMFEPAQLRRAIDEVHRARTARPGKPPLIALFVHGWKNNASDGSGNVWGFRQVLAGLVDQDPTREVVGVYVGWRGATVSAPILKEFTVFDRHHAAQRVPVPVMRGALQELMAAAKDPSVSSLPAAMVLIGHSFGGAVLESAVMPALDTAISAARAAKQTTVTWPADLIILLNEAQEGQESKPLLDLMAKELKPWTCTAPPNPVVNKRPALISISSTGDVATRGYFPGEQLIARPFQDKKYKRSDGGGKLYYETTAHNGTLRSHLFDRADADDIKAAVAKCQPAMRLTMSMGANDVNYIIVPDGAAANKSPYWVMHMPPSVVPDHSTIFTQVFRDVVISLVQNALLVDPQDELTTP